MDVSDRVKLVNHNDKEIVQIDFSDIGEGRVHDISDIIELASKIIQQKPEKSVLTLTMVHNAYVNYEISKLITDFTKSNAPYVKKAAVIGVKGVLKKLFAFVKKATRRNFNLYDDVETAKEWLTN